MLLVWFDLLWIDALLSRLLKSASVLTVVFTFLRHLTFFKSGKTQYVRSSRVLYYP